ARHVQQPRRRGRAGPRARAGARGVRLMATMSELYQTVILDHNRSPRNFREMSGATGQAEGFNPLCGDKVHVWLKVGDDGRIEDVSFLGEGCAISKASSSIMTQT